MQNILFRTSVRFTPDVCQIICPFLFFRINIDRNIVKIVCSMWTWIWIWPIFQNLWNVSSWWVEIFVSCFKCRYFVNEIHHNHFSIVIFLEKKMSTVFPPLSKVFVDPFKWKKCMCGVGQSSIIVKIWYQEDIALMVWQKIACFVLKDHKHQKEVLHLLINVQVMSYFSAQQ